MPLDHLQIKTRDYHKTKAFYLKALAPLGYQVCSGSDDWKNCGLGSQGSPDFFISQGVPHNPALHFAFVAESRELVDQVYMAALKAGARDNGAPGPRPHYHKDYYAAYFLDNDNYNVEVVCHVPATPSPTSD